MSPVVHEEFTLRPVDAHSTVLSTPSSLSAFREPSYSSSPSATSSPSSLAATSSPSLPSATPSSPSTNPAPPRAPTSADVHIPDVNPPPSQLGTSNRVVSQRYPPPHTGLDLMRLFPPPSPSQSSELKGGPTSYYFRDEERRYFAQRDRPSTLTAKTPTSKDVFRNRATAQVPFYALHTYQPLNGPSMFAPAPGGQPYRDQAVSSDGQRRAGKHVKRIYMPYTVPPSANRFTKP